MYTYVYIYIYIYINNIKQWLAGILYQMICGKHSKCRFSTIRAGAGLLPLCRSLRIQSYPDSAIRGVQGSPGCLYV